MNIDLEKLHELYKNLTKFLIKNNLLITTMESCTSGFIASLITDCEGASAIFKGAFVTYSNEAKIRNGVNALTIENSGVYSLDTARAMADASGDFYKTQISIGITGTFGNVDPNNKDSVPGKVFVAIKNGSYFCDKELTLPVNITRFESKIFVAAEVYALLENLLGL